MQLGLHFCLNRDKIYGCQKLSLNLVTSVCPSNTKQKHQHQCYCRFFISQFMNEQSVIEAFQQQKPVAFQDMYDHYAPAYYGYIKKTLYQPQACAETLKSAFVDIWNSAKDYDSTKERLFTWSFKIVRKSVSMKKIDLVLCELFSCHKTNCAMVHTACTRPV